MAAKFDIFHFIFCCLFADRWSHLTQLCAFQTQIVWEVATRVLYSVPFSKAQKKRIFFYVFAYHLAIVWIKMQKRYNFVSIPRLFVRFNEIESPVLNRLQMSILPGFFFFLDHVDNKIVLDFSSSVSSNHVQKCGDSAQMWETKPPQSQKLNKVLKMI